MVKIMSFIRENLEIRNLDVILSLAHSRPKERKVQENLKNNNNNNNNKPETGKE